MTIYFYGRVSSEEQKKLGLSISAQIEKANVLGIPKENIFIDGGKSAGVHEDEVEYYYDGRYFTTKTDLNNRKEFVKMMSLLKENDIVSFSKWDRISRSIIFMNSFVAWCERKKVSLNPLDESTDRLTRSILIVISEEELHKIKSRDKSIQQYLFEQGSHSFKCPFGYWKYPKGNPDRKMYVDKKKAEIVKQVFEMTLEGIDYKEICSKLKIFPNLYYDIIKNDIYIGKIHFGNETKQGLHEPIISSELFNQVQEIRVSHISKT